MRIWMDIKYPIQIVHDIEYGYGEPLRCKVRMRNLKVIVYTFFKKRRESLNSKSQCVDHSRLLNSIHGWRIRWSKQTNWRNQTRDGLVFFKTWQRSCKEGSLCSQQLPRCDLLHPFLMCKQSAFQVSILCEWFQFQILWDFVFHVFSVFFVYFDLTDENLAPNFVSSADIRVRAYRIVHKWRMTRESKFILMWCLQHVVENKPNNSWPRFCSLSSQNINTKVQ